MFKNRKPIFLRQISFIRTIKIKRADMVQTNSNLTASNYSTSFLETEYSLTNFHRSNQDTCLIHKPAVFEGQWVESGDLLADCSSSVGGELSLGHNILIAYLPWEGYNFEDAILISERLVYDDLYTSIHIERYDLEIRETKFGLEKITREIPDVSIDSLKHLHSSGIAKIGSWVEEGDILVGKTTPVSKKKQSPYQQLLYTILDRSLLPVRDTSFRAPKGIKAKIIGIQLFKNTKYLANNFNHESKSKKFSLENKILLNLKKQINKAISNKKDKEQYLIKQSINKNKFNLPNLQISNLLNPSPSPKGKGKQKLGTKNYYESEEYLSHSLPSYINPQYGRNVPKKEFGELKRIKNSNIIRVRSFPFPKGEGDGAGNKIKQLFHISIKKNKETSFFQSYNFKKTYKFYKITVLNKIKIFSNVLSFSKFNHTFSSSPSPLGKEKGKGEVSNNHQFISQFNKKFISKNITLKNINNSSLTFTKTKEMRSEIKVNKVQNENNLLKSLAVSGNISSIQIYLAEKRRTQVGDKMAGRHGNKGIISQILPIEDMPFLPDGTPLDMVLNPLGVPSRMNVGQIYECLLGLAGKYLGEKYKIIPFDEIYGPESSRSFVYSKLNEALIKTGKNWIFNPKSPGKLRLYDGRTGESFNQTVTVGYAYMLRLVHMVDDKIHARSTGPYSLVTQQPLRGRSKVGGQRLGEMEVWALEGYGAAFTLLEMLTIKSDDMANRMTLWSNLILNKELSMGTPESFKVLICDLQALCLDIGLFPTLKNK